MGRRSTGAHRQSTNRQLISTCALALMLCAPGHAQQRAARQPPPHRAGTVTVHFDPQQPANRFVPARTLGATIDGHERGELARMLRRANVAQMLTAGLKPLSYRLRTELGGEAWHWNPQGHWSDAAHEQGYWTSASESNATLSVSYGYRLPRRGSTIDQANDDGYSRLDDGDTASFWKSNPYLDQHFTHDANAQHPQWVVVDLGRSVAIDALRILWGDPFAIDYEIDYSSGSPHTFKYQIPPNHWQPFARGLIKHGRGGDVLLRLATRPVRARYVRVLMTATSGTDSGSTEDIRDRLGYAIRELYVGRMDARGHLHDLMRHARARAQQTVVFASSTDPWHRALDLDERVEQPGFDLVRQSGLPNNQPMLTPVSILYGTPENAAAEVRYLEAHGPPLTRVEMGEEPEDQYISPEDYGALYVQWADALHGVDPRLQLGGPCFVTIAAERKRPGPDDLSQKEWLARLLNYLRAHKHLAAYNFFSFEWYPYDNVCASPAPQLAAMPQKLTSALVELQRDVLPKGLPVLMTEYGYSAFAGPPEVRIEGALMNADIVGLFLTLGGAQSYLYGYEPNELIQERRCGWGNNMLFGLGDDGQIKYRTATYYGARMLTELWAQPADEQLEVYSAGADILNDRRQALVTAYALRRPDRRWALLLINKDPRRPVSVSVRWLNTATHVTTGLRGRVDLYQFSAQQYEWQAAGAQSHTGRSLPPAHFKLDAPRGLRLPPFSLSVVQTGAQD